MEAGARAENENNQENIGERQENLQQEANANVNVVDGNEERRELIEPQNQGEIADGAILNEIEPVQDDLPANNAAMFGGQLRESESLIREQNERISYITTLVQSMLQQQNRLSNKPISKHGSIADWDTKGKPKNFNKMTKSRRKESKSKRRKHIKTRTSARAAAVATASQRPGSSRRRAIKVISSHGKSRRTSDVL